MFIIIIIDFQSCCPLFFGVMAIVGYVSSRHSRNIAVAVRGPKSILISTLYQYLPSQS